MGSRPKEMKIAGICPQNAFALADGPVGEFTQKSDSGRASTRAAERLEADPTEGSSSGPGANMARAEDNAETVEQKQGFEAFSSRSNILKSCDLRLKRLAAGIRCWGAFRDLMGRPHFLSTEEAVLAWPARFPAGRTFLQYLPHLEKACFRAATRPQITNQGRSTGGERVGKRVGESGG